MDTDSHIGIQKDNKHLEILVRSGGLYFHVTEPLEEDETMNIRTSNMMAGIRGTCGWIQAADQNRSHRRRLPPKPPFRQTSGRICLCLIPEAEPGQTLL